MDVYVPKQIADEIVRQANAENKRRTAMEVADANGQIIPLLSFGPEGFSVADDAPRLRGEVKIKQGSRHILDCLIVAATAEPGAIVYEYKRRTHVLAGQPLDYVSDRVRPIGLIERG
ncbi:hypothetical protein [Pontivivens insulae]|uniref:Uncharacterized protein n=1 Tax=Pontivivens insulae TaxID=1639689 RepID=A0A2R8AFI0_9RHOB|nr:hypothetical protein [Pontivivens insulae]RED12102.1 hypothetical protein DFR53_2815 [Pontivivens insulae]SPF30858.1 hypothetical protein POI8812_03202 [Pontivivens insulae]